jgi:DNA-binding NtrC family response regulator
MYYRLSGVDIVLPPLRSRGHDIIELAEHFLQRHRQAVHLQLSAQASSALLTYDWPGNVRELERVIQAAIALAADQEIQLADLPDTVTARFRGTVLPAASGGLTAREFAARYAEIVLRECNGNRTEACRRLGISHHTLKARLRELERTKRKKAAA